MVVEKDGICVITFPIINAFSTPLSNLINILTATTNNLYVILGCYEYINLNNAQQAKIIRHNYTSSKFLLLRIFNYFLLQVKIALSLISISRNVKYCIFYMELGPLLPLVIAKLLNKKCIWMIPSSFVKMKEHRRGIKNDPLSFISLLFQYACYSLTDKITVASPRLINEWGLTRYKQKILVTHEHFIDIDKFKILKTMENRSNTIGFIGRFSEEKGIINFIKAIPIIIKSKPDLRFLIIGNGQLNTDVEYILNFENINNIVSVIGWVEHEKLPIYLNNLKFIVIPSFMESGPLVALEAMACGTPVLGTKVGLLPDLINEPVTGVLLENNTPECIADNVINIINERDLAKISLNARCLIEKDYNYEVALKRYNAIFK